MGHTTSTTYLGKCGQTRKSVIRAEESFPISGQGYTVGKLADKTNYNILIDTGTGQSYMSTSFYIQSKILHALPNFVPTTQRIQVGNKTICGSTICNTSYNRNTQTSI